MTPDERLDRLERIMEGIAEAHKEMLATMASLANQQSFMNGMVSGLYSRVHAEERKPRQQLKQGDLFLPGQHVIVSPHGSPDQGRKARVYQVAMDGTRLKLHWGEAYLDFLDLERVLHSGKPWGPWIDRNAGGHFEVELDNEVPA